MNLAVNLTIGKFISSAMLIGAMFIALTLASAHAAELLMFEQAGCEWCEAFDRQIVPVYGKTVESLRAPLHRVDIERPLPADLSFIQKERLTPLFVLVDRGREIGRIRGYPGPESFWTQFSMLFEKLGAPGTGGEHAQMREKQLRIDD
jgi:thioredoxin-related protein